MKRKLSAALALLIVLSQPCAFASQVGAQTDVLNYTQAAEGEKVQLYATEQCGDYKLNVKSDDTAVIVRYRGDDDIVVIPEDMEDYHIVGIEDGAFANSAYMESVTIPSSVTYIGVGAFRNCSALKDIIVSEDNENYKAQDGVLFNKDMTELVAYSIGMGAKEYTIPEGVTQIDDYAFYGSKILEKTAIPSSVETIGSCAFGRCGMMKEFELSADNPNYTISDGVLYNKAVTDLIAYPARGGVVEYTVPESVTQIEEYAFYGCESLKKVTLPNNITELKGYIFCGCASLENAEIPENVEEIGDGVFENCGSLKSMTIPDSVIIIGKSLFSGCGALEEVKLPAMIEKIGWYSFWDCSSLKSIEIPEEVTEIEEHAFSGCSTLKSIIIPEGVTKIDDALFENCSSLENVTISADTESIGNYAFSGCVALKEMTIPESVSEIGDCAFYGCDAITAFAVSDDNESYTAQDGVLFDKDITELVAYPTGATAKEYAVCDGVEKICNYAFFGSALEKITIPESVSEIGDYAFLMCGNLKEFAVDENNEDYAAQDGVLFNKYITILESYPIGSTDEKYTIPDSVDVISVAAFAGCGNLKEFAIGEDNEFYTVQDGVLFNKEMTELAAYPIGATAKEYTVPTKVENIGYYAFYNSDTLEKVIIPNSDTRIKNFAFDNCDNLTLYGYSGSRAQTYAKNCDIPFSVIQRSGLSFDDVSIKDLNVVSAADDTVKVNLNVSDTTESMEGFAVYVAAYDSENELVGIVKKDVSENGYSGDVEFAVTAKPTSVKVFAVDAVNGVSPLCDCMEKPV